MATTSFTDGSTVIVASWLNEVDALVHDIFNGLSTSPVGTKGSGPDNRFDITQSWNET